MELLFFFGGFCGFFLGDCGNSDQFLESLPDLGSKPDEVLGSVGDGYGVDSVSLIVCVVLVLSIGIGGLVVDIASFKNCSWAVNE